MDITEFLSMITRAASVVRDLVVGIFANIVGWYLFGSGLLRMATWGSPRRNYGAMSIIVRSGIGTVLIQSSQWLNMMALSLTGYGVSAQNAMSVTTPGAGSGIPGMVFSAVLAWLATLGVIAILHGTSMFVKAGDGSSSQPTNSDPKFTAVVFIVSGCIGINLWRFTSGLI